MSKLILGVDPGATGAIALFAPNEGKMLWVKDTPNKKVTLTTKKVTNKIDIKALQNMFERVLLVANEQNAELIVHIEQVQAFSKQSAPAAFNFGYAAALPFAIASAMNLEIRFVHPAVWKRAVGLQASEKDDARLLAIQLFPNMREQLKLKKHVDRADAMFIAAHIF